MPTSALDAIPLAFEHTRQQLFTRFRFGQWTRLALVGLLAGELGSGGGCNFNSGNFNRRMPHFPDSSLAVLIGLGAALLVVVAAVVLIGIILMYVGSVMRFILFDSVMARECHIGLGWRRRQGPGFRFFLWRLAYAVFALGSMVVLVGIPAGFGLAMGWLQAPSEHVLPLVLGGILLFFVVVTFFIALAVIYVMTKDFVIPQMALENIGPMEAWRRLWRMMQTEKASYAGYLGMKILMAIAAGIVIGIAAVILGLVIAVPAIAVGLLAAITGQSAGLTWNVYTITLAIVVGTILLGMFLYLVSLLSVPVVVFFPAYSIYFFAARYAPLYAALNPAVIAAPGLAQPPAYPPLPEPTG